MPGKGKIQDEPKAGSNGFESRPEDINRSGRPPKIYTVVRDMGYSKDDCRTVFGELIWYANKELKKSEDDDNLPYLVRMVAGQLLEAKKKKDWGKIREIMEHHIGKPTQKEEIEYKQGNQLQVEIVSANKHKHTQK